MPNLLFIGKDRAERRCQLHTITVPYSKLTLKGAEDVYSTEFLKKYLPTLEPLSTEVPVINLGMLSNVGLNAPVVDEVGNDYVAKIAVMVFYLGNEFLVAPIPYLRALTFEKLRYLDGLIRTDFGKYLTQNTEKEFGTVIDFLAFVAKKEYPEKPELTEKWGI
mgnify:CR=1 FL=1